MYKSILILLILFGLCNETTFGQNIVFQEQAGLVVIEAESATLVDQWVSESTESSFAGDGYIRWNGSNHFNDSSQGILEYKIHITNPGLYHMRLRMSHEGAPAGDQENDCWTRMDNGPFIKTFHPGNRINDGFTFHSFHEPNHGEFASPTYDLSAGEHTFYIAARSYNVRIDRIHFYKNNVPNPESLEYPESPIEESTNEREGGDNDDIAIHGDRIKWHPITFNLKGPRVNEDDDPNPFLIYRYDVLLTSPTGNQVRVPGFFAGDGDAANTGAQAGNIWKAHFVPSEEGTWKYRISFRRGENVAVSTNPTEGEPTQFDGQSGSIQIASPDSRSKGMLRYVGERYLQFENGDYFIKGGANSPENLLAYQDFDGTYNNNGGNFIKNYRPHTSDWQAGDPVWQNGKGKGIIGAINYLASQKVNAMFFITMNVNGDGDDVWPWTNPNTVRRYDVSKLEQWEMVFSHMSRRGILLHFLTQETENELLLDNGDLGVARKLYYRELIARFSHHPALIWNLGEENDENTTAQRKAFAQYIRDLDPYDHPIVLHTFPGTYDENYTPLLGFEAFEGPSLQVARIEQVHELTKSWIQRSYNNNRPWIVSVDEAGPWQEGILPDGPGNNHELMRRHVLWGNLMAGGAGVEWYFGYDYPNNDLNAEDWRSREQVWEMTAHATNFFSSYLPFHEMESANELTTRVDDFVLAKTGDIYAIYTPDGSETSLRIDGADEAFEVYWYNPRTGGSLVTSQLQEINGPGTINLGSSPIDQDRDWVILVQRIGARSPGDQPDPDDREVQDPISGKACFLQQECGAGLMCAGSGVCRPIVEVLSKGTNSIFWVDQLSGKNSNDGSKDSPFETIEQAMRPGILQPGDAVIIREGTYFEPIIPATGGSPNNPITIAGYPGEDVVISGAQTISGTWTASAGAFEITWPFPALWHRYKGADDPFGPARLRDVLIADGQMLRAVYNRGDLKEGTFYLEGAPDNPTTMYVILPENKDPNESLMQTSRLNHLFNPSNNEPNCRFGDVKGYFRLVGLTFRHAANDGQSGAVCTGSEGSLFENITVEWTNGTGFTISGKNHIVRGVRAYHNGMSGIRGSYCENCVLEYAESKYNNWKGYKVLWESGGGKWLYNKNSILRRIDFSSNEGPGLWFDMDNFENIIEQSRFDNNLAINLFLEWSSDRNVVRNNVLTRARPFNEANPGIGLEVRAANDNSIIHNTFMQNNGGGLRFRADERSPTLNNRYFNNLFIRNSDPGGQVAQSQEIDFDGHTSIEDAMSNTGDGNAFWPTSSPQHTLFSVDTRGGSTVRTSTLSTWQDRSQSNQQSQLIDPNKPHIRNIDDATEGWRLVEESQLIGSAIRLPQNSPTIFNDFDEDDITDQPLAAGADQLSNRSIFPTLLGDVSRNGIVSTYDATLILQHVTGDLDLSNEPNADVSGDQLINTFDAVLILQYLTNAIACFPIEADCP